MNYKLTVEIKKDLDISNENIRVFLTEINKRFDIVNRRLLFFSNVSIEEYNPNLLNSDLEYIINTDDKNFEKTISNFLYNYDFIERYSLIINNKEHKLKDVILVTPKQIYDLVDDIDKLYFIRQRLQQVTKFLPEKNKREYLSLVKELSLTKYHLKSSTISLRVVNLYKEFSEIEAKLYEYARSFGVELDFKYEIVNVKLDKIIFYKIKSSFIDFLHTLIDFEIDKRVEMFNYEKLKIDVKLLQDFNKLRIFIKSSNLIENKKYKDILDNDVIDLSENEEVREQQLSIINIYKSIKKIGKITYTDDDNLVFSIKLDFLILEALIVRNELGYFAIDNDKVNSVYDYNEENISVVNNIVYYKLNEVLVPILNECKNPKKIIMVGIKNQNFMFLVKEVLYEEEIFVRELLNPSDKYIGEALLKDTKRALVINLKSYI